MVKNRIVVTQVKSKVMWLELSTQMASNDIGDVLLCKLGGLVGFSTNFCRGQWGRAEWGGGVKYPHTNVKMNKGTSFLRRFYLFLERGEWGEKERKRNINVCLPLSHPPTGDLAHNPGMCPKGNRTGTLCFATPLSIHWATPARGELSLKRPLEALKEELSLSHTTTHRTSQAPAKRTIQLSWREKAYFTTPAGGRIIFS